MKGKNFLILSPHLDDAVLNCCNHILSWKKTGYKILVLNIFTKFGKGASRQEIERKKEDLMVMEELALFWKNLDFIDGKYRHFDKKLVYRDNESLFSGKVSEYDSILPEMIFSKIKKLGMFDRIAVPLGIGKHADHILTRQAAEENFPKNKLFYYIDFPYALRRQNWKLSHLRMFTGKILSIRLMNEVKIKLLKKYTSQYDLLFKSKPFYPEILLQ